MALTVLSFGLTQLTTDGVLAAAALVLAAAMVAVFVVRQLRCAHPLIDLAPMKNRAFWPALILVTIAMMSMFSMSVLLPLYFEGAAGMTAFAAGLVILVPVLANAGATLLGGRIMDKRGEWPLLPLGFGGIAIGFIALVAVAPQLSVPAVFAAMLVMYVAVGFIFSPSQTAGLRALPPRQNPFGVALMTTFAQIMPHGHRCISASCRRASGRCGFGRAGAGDRDGFALAMAGRGHRRRWVRFALAYARAARKRAAVQAVERAAQSPVQSVLASIMEADPTRCRSPRRREAMRAFVDLRSAGCRWWTSRASGGLRVRRRCDALPADKHPLITGSYSLVEAANSQTFDERLRELIELW
ncbi:MAG: MFS transporter [Eggerthella lenta]